MSFPALRSGTTVNPLGVSAPSARFYSFENNPAGNGTYSDADWRLAIQRAIAASVDFLVVDTPWIEIETAPGVYDLSRFTRWMEESAAVGLSCWLNVRAINNAEGRAKLPAWLASTAYDDPAMTNGISDLLTAIATVIPTGRVFSVSLGNEVDTYLSAHTPEIPEYAAFITAAKATAQALWGLQTHVVASFQAKISADTPAHWAVYNAIHAATTLATFTYYFINNDFTIRSTDSSAMTQIIGDDLGTILTSIGTQPFMFEEFGCPSSPVLNSSEDLQRDCVAAAYAAFGVFADLGIVKAVIWLWMSDYQAYILDAIGLTGNAREYIGSIGLRRAADDSPKPAWDEMLFQLGGTNLPGPPSTDLSGTLSFVGVLQRQTMKAVGGSLTPAATLVKQTARSFVGSLTPSATLTKRTARVLSGSLTPSGSLTKQLQRALTATLTSSGALVKRTARALAGSLSPAGSLGAATTRVLALTGAISPSGALTRQPQKTLAGGLTPSGDLLKRTTHLLSGALTPSGALAAVRTLLVFLTGSLTPAGSLTKQSTRALSGTLDLVGSLTKQAGKALSGSLTPSGTVVAIRTILKALTGTLSFSGTLTKHTARSLSGALTPVGDLIKQTWKSLTGAVSAVGDLIIMFGGLLGGGGTPGAVQAFCGLESPGIEQSDSASNALALFSRDAARQGHYGFPLRIGTALLNQTLSPAVAGDGPHALSWAYLRARIRVRSYCASGEDILWRAVNNRGSLGDATLTIDNLGRIHLYSISGNWASRVEASAYFAAYTPITLSAGVWYQVEWFIAWGINAFVGDVPAEVSPRMRLLAIQEDNLSQVGWTDQAGSFPTGWMASEPAAHGQRTYAQTISMSFGGPAVSGNSYQGSRVDIDSLCAEGLFGNETVGGIADDYSAATIPPGTPLTRMYVPTRIPLTGTTTAGTWVVSGTGAGMDYRLLNDSPPRTGSTAGCISSSTASDTFEVTCGTPADAGFGEDTCYGVFVSVYLVSSPVATHTLRIKIGSTTYSQATPGLGGNTWVRFQLPTPGVSPEFTSFPATEEIRVGVVKNAGAGTVDIQAIVVQVVGLEDWTPAPDPSIAVSVMSGVYTGTGSWQEVVLPHEAHWIWTGPAAAGVSDGAYWYDTKLGATEWVGIGQATELLAPSANGFVVAGNDFKTNRSGTVYRWFAIRDGTSRLLYRGAFTEMTAGNYSIVDGLGLIPLTFGTPVALWAHIDDFQAPGSTGGYYRGLSHAGGTGVDSSPLAASADVSTAIRSMPTPGGGAVIGTTLQQSDRAQTSFTAWSLAFLQTPLWAVATWVGDNVSSRDIPVAFGGMGAGWCVALGRNGSTRYYRHASMATIASMSLASGASSNTGITGFKNNVVTVGSSLNATGVTYELLAIVDPAWDPTLNGGLGGSGGSGTVSDAPPPGACVVTFGSGTDSGGGAGCAPAPAVGSDSGGGSGCQVS